MNRKEKQEVIAVFRTLQGYAEQLNFTHLKNNFRYVMNIIIFVLSFDELDKMSLQMLKYFILLNPIKSDEKKEEALFSSGETRKSGYHITSSTNFPTLNAYNSTLNGDNDVFVTKLNPDGQSLVYSTYLGGSDLEYGVEIAVDAIGATYVTGRTESTDFPTVNAYNSTSNGDYDVFVTKLNPDGQTLNYSTFLGGSGREECRGIAVDSTGAAYLTGYTRSTNFPTVNAYYPTYSGGDYDVFVTKLNPDGQTLNYSIFLGGCILKTHTIIKTYCLIFFCC